MSDRHRSSLSIDPGDELRIVKLRPDGSEAATYPGTLVTESPSWIVARATWTFRRMEFDYWTFEPGDYLFEYFAKTEPFNAFVVFSPEDEFKGWYCNITHPTTVTNDSVFWHDLYIDVVQKRDGEIIVLDEDELEESRLHQTDPPLHRMINNARDSVVEKMRNGAYPFSEFEAPNG
jgi:predicted RNA-binding protein associated with RNAse of E/G family